MSDAEAKLAAFFREYRPRASDAAFRLAVLERRAQQRFYRYTGWIVAGGVLAVGCVAAMSPDLSAWTASQPISGAIPALSVVMTGACMLLAYTRIRQTF
jgi:TRAP-type C4-dicarboxylate transport system permease small subunit